MTLEELLENVVFAATLDSYIAVSLNDRDLEAHAHLVARLALSERYCSDGLALLFDGERRRVAVLLRALNGIREGQVKYSGSVPRSDLNDNN
jgi:hypothetical protein